MEPGGDFFGLGDVFTVRAGAFEDGPTEFTGDAAAKADDAFVELFEKFAVDARFEVEALEVGLGGEFDEVAEAGTVLGEKREVVTGFFEIAGIFFEAAVGGDVGLVADDGVDAFLFGLLIELESAVEVAVVGEGQGVHAVGLGAGDELVDGAGAVEEAVMAVAVEVNEGLSAHEIPRRAGRSIGAEKNCEGGCHFTIFLIGDKRWERG